MPPNGSKNLITADKLSLEEARENGRKGGIKSGEVRREKASTKKLVQLMLEAQVPDNLHDVKKTLQNMGVPETDMNFKAAMIAGQMSKALSYEKDTRATEFVFRMGGELDENQNAESKEWSGIPGDLLGSAWVDIYRSILDREYFQYDLRGGRGSLKSSFAGLIIVDLIMRNKNTCALAARAVKDDLRDSVYGQIVWAIDVLNVTEQFKCTVNPMEITRLETGQKIFFRGANDPGKLKSLKPPKDMHVAFVWIEEADQLKGAEGLRSITQSAFRGGDDGILIRTYNTPISQSHHINVEARSENPRRFVHHSHFKNAPKKWLGQTFWDEAESLKATSERAYKHEYDGEAVGTGESVFENITTRPIADDEIRKFDRLYYGLDWGFYPDPMHFVEMYYNAAQRKLYIINEKRLWKSTNENTAKELEAYKRIRITADSAEPKSIEDLHRWGFDIRGAIKGPGSVDYSHKWLQSLNEIIIDSKRCPYTSDEFLKYEYERTKDGEIISGYPDKDNHAIDAVRYALEEIWRRRGL